MHLVLGAVMAALARKKGGQAEKDTGVPFPRFRTGPVRTLHVLDGRVRFGVPSIRERPDAAPVLREKLPRLEGVDSVEVSPITGSVLICFAPDKIQPGLLFAAVVRLLDLEEELKRTPTPALTREIRALGGSLNRVVYDKTGGVLDLHSAVLLALVGLGVRQMVTQGGLALPAGLTLMFWAMNGFFREEESE